MDFETIIYEKKGAVAKIIFNRPDKMNAMTDVTFREISKALDIAENDKEVRAVVMTGRGKAFCAGVDLKFAKDNLTTLEKREEFYRLGSKEKLLKIEAMSKPVIAAVNGYAIAGGFEIMLACDFVIAADDAKIGDQHMKFGRFGAGGSPYRLTQIVGIRKAKELVLTGKLVTGKEAEQMGMINQAVPLGELETAVQELVNSLIDKSPVAMKISKSCINQSAYVDAEARYELLMMSAIVNSASDAFTDGMDAFIEKRKP